MTYLLVLINETGAAVVRRRRWLPLVPLALAGLGCSAWLGLNFDVRYGFGGLRAGPGSLYGDFQHRPLAFRAVTWLLDLGPSVLTPGARSGAAAEVIIRGEALLLVTAACVLLWAGLRRYRPGRLPVLVAAGIWCAFALAPNWTFLEPDWAGALFAVAAAGAALLPRRAWVGTILAALLVLLCVATKLTTAPYAVIAGGVVWLLDRRRAYLVAGWSAGLVAVWLVLTWLFLPLEWQWMGDMAALAPNTPVNTPPGRLDWPGFAESAGNLLVVSPVVLVIPAATAAVARSVARPIVVVCAVVVAVVLTAVPVLAQGEYYLYQWAALPVLAAGLGAAALAKAPAAVLVPALAGGVLSMFALTRSVDWRATHFPLLLTGCVLAAVLGSGFAFLPGFRAATPPAVVAAVVAFGAANLPAASYSVTVGHAGDTNLSRYQATADMRGRFGQLRARLGPDLTMQYLAFGDVSYLLGYPTECRYPSPVWLQRSAALHYVRDFASYADNLSCLDSAEDYLLIDRSWFDLPGMAPVVSTRVDELYDCGQAIHVTDSIDVCPRRG
ncbi:hypothetical protein [Amycolatopsis sp.]|uniref:hypothetical protein n=1 Tax=Amycolatopsis sp. TaxID=37632 RepID=UPI002B692347|nr:hypothetical protein [Amycolatopsis sp.]HVV14600.1 hypothetical protein [Amycolatopsis sp.]